MCAYVSSGGSGNRKVRAREKGLNGINRQRREHCRSAARGKRPMRLVTRSRITIPWSPGCDHVISVNVKPAKLPIQMLRTLILEFQSMVTSAARDALTPRIANSESTLHRILDTSIVPVFLVAFHGTRQCSGLANLVTTFFFFPTSLFIFFYILRVNWSAASQKESAYNQNNVSLDVRRLRLPSPRVRTIWSFNEKRLSLLNFFSSQYGRKHYLVEESKRRKWL